MNFAIYLLALVGAVVIALALLTVCAWAWELFLDWRKTPHSGSFNEGIWHARNLLANESWWFGESPETMQLLQDLARGLNVSEARERWRKARSARKKTEANQQ